MQSEGILPNKLLFQLLLLFNAFVLPIQALKENMAALMEFPQVTETFNGKALFVGGDQSPYLQQPQYLKDVNTLFPNAEISIIKDAGHWIHFEKPTEFLDVISKIFR